MISSACCTIIVISTCAPLRQSHYVGLPRTICLCYGFANPVPVPAVYYAHLASNRARAHEDISETERKLRDSGPTKSTHERPVEEPKPLLDMINRIGMRWGMWYI